MNTTQEVELCVWNVEHGLAVHVRTLNGYYIVIDMGVSQNASSPMMNLQGKIVKLLVITHPHIDHFRDIVNMGNVTIESLWTETTYSDIELLTDVQEADKEVVRKYCELHDSINPILVDKNDCMSIDGVGVQIFSTTKCDKSNKNNCSAIVVLSFGDSKVVVCGDNERESFMELLKNPRFKGVIQKVDILIAPHHGRESGWCVEFMSIVQPYLTIISDTVKSETSVTNLYDEYTKGMMVYNTLEGDYEERKCLSTRQDKDIYIGIEGDENLRHTSLTIIKRYSWEFWFGLNSKKRGSQLIEV